MFPHIHAFRSPPVPMHANRRPCAIGADLRCSMISLPKLIYRLVLAVADGPPLVFTAAHVSSPHRDLRCRARFSLGAVY